LVGCVCVKKEEKTKTKTNKQGSTFVLVWDGQNLRCHRLRISRSPPSLYYPPKLFCTTTKGGGPQALALFYTSLTSIDWPMKIKQLAAKQIISKESLSYEQNEHGAT
jgi:hypothetical protein